jgi:hypothetical protein
MYAILLALPLAIMNLSEVGMALVAVYMFTGLVCLQSEWTRNIMIGCYIVIGFWCIAGSSL